MVKQDLPFGLYHIILHELWAEVGQQSHKNKVSVHFLFCSALSSCSCFCVTLHRGCAMLIRPRIAQNLDFQGCFLQVEPGGTYFNYFCNNVMWLSIICCRDKNSRVESNISFHSDVKHFKQNYVVSETLGC